MIDQFLIWAVALVMIFIWLDTDAVVEYAVLLNIPLPLIVDYLAYKQTQNVTYPDFLAFHMNSFGTRLLTCPYCLTVVLNAMFYSIYAGLHYTFNPIVLCVNIVVGWAVYPFLSKVSK
jgi:hypothetical protein